MVTCRLHISNDWRRNLHTVICSHAVDEVMKDFALVMTSDVRGGTVLFKYLNQGHTSGESGGVRLDNVVNQLLNRIQVRIWSP